MLNAPPEKGRVEIIDQLRGLAAFAVCFFHFASGAQIDIGSEALKEGAKYGALGVHVFFVISGFVIPYTLYKSDFRLRSFGVFILKRITRLDPPYLVSILIALGAQGLLVAFVRNYHDEALVVSWQQVLAHLGYANALLKYPWLNDVYWTLAIEFQYYIFLALAFPLIRHRHRLIRLGTLSCLMVSSLVFPDRNLLFAYLPWFVFGIMTCHFHCRQAGKREYLAAVVILFAFTSWQRSPVEAATLAATALAIAFVRMPTLRGLSMLGAISYSLYLTHGPIGRLSFTAWKGLHLPEWTNYLAILAATAAALAFAAGFYFLFERPAQRWASRIKYRTRPANEELEVGVNAATAQSTATTRT